MREIAHGLEHFFLRDRVNRFGVAAFDAAAGAKNFAAGGAVAHLEVLHEGGGGKKKIGSAKRKGNARCVTRTRKTERKS